MKKALALLTASLAILIGLIVYGKVVDEPYNVSHVMSTDVSDGLTEPEIPTYAETETVAEYEDMTNAFEMAVTEAEADWNEEIEGLFAEEKMDVSDTSVMQKTDMYAYKLLKGDEKDVYNAIYNAIVNYESAAAMPTTDVELLDRAFNYVMIDHPEIFYVEGYKYTRYMLGGKLMRITFSADYSCNEAVRDSKEADIELVVSTILKNIDSDASDFDKIRFVFETLINSTEYDISAPDNQNIASVFLGKRSVCQGYAKATELLLGRLGIEATLVTGRIVGGESHAWNLVKADGEWYYLDTTWGDASYQSTYEDDGDTQNNPINYDYMCVTTKDIENTHVSDATIELPICSATMDNYYVHEGLCIDNYDEAVVGDIINNAIINGQKTVTLHATNPPAYERIIEELLDNQVIFRYLPGDGNKVRYTSNPNSRSVTFWL